VRNKKEVMRRTILTTILSIFFTTYSLSQDLELNKEIISFSTEISQLEGCLVKPKDTVNYPVVIFVHGDGGINRDMFGAYEPIWNYFNDAGYGCLSWDKPGIGNSKGKTQGYVQQSIPERVEEVIAASDYLKTRNDIDTNNIGLWGISQAGWVLPRVSMERVISFMIFVSCPTTTGDEQSTYLIKKNLIISGYSPSIADSISKAFYNSMICLNEGKTYESYKQYKRKYDTVPFITNLGWLLTEEEYISEQKEPKEFYDPGPAIRKLKCPLLIIYGELDSQVDPLRGIKDFKEYLSTSDNPDYTIKLIEKVNHAIWKAESGSLDELIKLLQSGKYIYSNEYLELMKKWIKNRK